MTMLLPHLASRLYATPLLLSPSKLDIILAVLGSRVGWPDQQTAMALPQTRASPHNIALSAAGIAVVAVQGSLVRRSMAMDAQSGMTSYGEIASMLDEAARDPGVAGILLDIDSPGGEAGGVFELSRKIRDINALKPVWAVASDAAYSAAYAIASAASRVFVTETGGVGSIGVIAMHVDQSARDAKEGYRFTAISAGELKNDLSPHEPINKAAATRLQAEVDRLYGLFVDHVAAMRGLAAKTVRATQAGLFFGPDAVRCGLADALASPDQVVAEFSNYLSTQRIVHSVAKPLFITAGTHTSTCISDPKEIFMQQDTASKTEPSAPPSAQPSAPPSAPPSAVDKSTDDENNQTKTLPIPLVPSEPLVPVKPAPVQDDLALTHEKISALSQAASLAARAEALTIAELCQLAGQSQRITGFLAQGASATQVRQSLLAARAQSEEITSNIHPDAALKASPGNANDVGALMAAVKRLTQKN
jgi:signal peptide peptidase SppA